MNYANHRMTEREQMKDEYYLCNGEVYAASDFDRDKLDTEAPDFAVLTREETITFLNPTPEFHELYDTVDTARRKAYSSITDPLYNKANRIEGKEPEVASAYRIQADFLVERIKKDNPWPELSEAAI